jgi:hypothetical protein
MTNLIRRDAGSRKIDNLSTTVMVSVLSTIMTNHVTAKGVTDFKRIAVVGVLSTKVEILVRVTAHSNRQLARAYVAATS